MHDHRRIAEQDPPPGDHGRVAAAYRLLYVELSALVDDARKLLAGRVSERDYGQAVRSIDGVLPALRDFEERAGIGR
jgi:hypothetical protein